MAIAAHSQPHRPIQKHRSCADHGPAEPNSSGITTLEPLMAMDRNPRASHAGAGVICVPGAS